MKTRLGIRRWLAVLACAALAGVCAVYLRPSGAGIRKTLRETRQSLRRQGFKTDLAEFNLSAPAEARAFENALTGFSRGQTSFVIPDLMPAAGSNAATVVWRQNWAPVHRGPISWALVRGEMDLHETELDAACQAALSGPIQFTLDPSRGRSMLLPHLAPMKRLADMLACRTALELHDNNKDSAWTNLLAATRLVTAWEPEPTEISHLVRFTLMTALYAATWQALQAQGWSDDRLARLQQEWQSADFFSPLPETAAFERADAVDVCQHERKMPMPSRFNPGGWSGLTLRSPSVAWRLLNDYYDQWRYRYYGTYADENAILLFYRDREQELRAVVQAKSWSAMSVLPAVTNPPRFTSPYSSRLRARLNLGAISATFAARQGGSWLARAAEAEARRRLIVTAIALERYRGRHGGYPKTLGELTPEFLPHPPVDFMDGEPLRYRLADDGPFILYSVGLDGVDHGGQWQPRNTGLAVPWSGLPLNARLQADLIWPRPASGVEVELLRQDEQAAQTLKGL